jgi:hypothetical protein
MLSGPAYAQETPKYDYVEAFKPFFIHRWDQKPVLQADSPVMPIGRILQTIT